MSAVLGVLPPWGTLAGESARALLAGAGFFLILAAAETWKRRSNPPVEWTRKLVHFAGGLLVAAFPWLFASRWTVLALAAAFTGFIGLSRHFRLLGSVHGVQRRSEGALYYPIAICLLFMVARDRPVVYLISVLTLILSDALAAVLGSAYGRWIYPVESDRKSVEGSAVFSLTTFLVVLLPLLLLTPIDRGAIVLIGIQVALLVTCFEAISMRGTDNLIVPLGTCYLLLKMMPRPAEWLGLLLLAQIGIIGLIALLACRTHFLTFSGGIAAQLALYGALSLGGLYWALPSVLAMAGLMAVERIASRRTGTTRGGYQVLAVFYTSLVPAVLLLLSNTLSTLLPVPGLFQRGNPFYLPFLGALAAQVAIAVSLLRDYPPKKRRPLTLRRPLAAAAIGFLIVVPISLWAAGQDLTVPELAIPAMITAGGTTLYGANRRSCRPRDDVRLLRLAAACVAVATAIALPLYVWWLGVM